MAYNNRVDLFSTGSEKPSSGRVSLTSAAQKGAANRGEYISKRNSAKADDFGSHLSKASAKANRVDSNGGVVRRETAPAASQPVKQNVVKTAGNTSVGKATVAEAAVKADTVSKTAEPVKVEAKIKNQDYDNNVADKAIAHATTAGNQVPQQVVQGENQPAADDEIPVQEDDVPEVSAAAQNPNSASAIFQFMSHSNSIESLLNNRRFNPMPMQRVAMPIAEAMVQSAAQNIQGVAAMQDNPQQMVQQLKNGAQQLSAAVQSMMEAVEDVIDLPDGFKEVARQVLQPSSVEALLTPIKGENSAQIGQGMLNMLSGNVVPRQNMVWQQPRNMQASVQPQVNVGEIMPNIQGAAGGTVQTPQVKVDSIQGVPVEVQTSPGTTESAMLNMLSGGVSFRRIGSMNAVNQVQTQVNVQQPAVQVNQVQANGPQVQPAVNAVEMPAANQVQVQANVQQPAVQVNQVQANGPQVQPAVNAVEMPAANQVQAQANVQQPVMQANGPQVQSAVNVTEMPAANQVQAQANVQQPAMQANGPQVQPGMNAVEMPAANQVQAQANVQQPVMQADGPQVQPVVNAVEMPAANQVQAQANVQQPVMQANGPQVQPAVNVTEMPAANQAQANVQQPAMQANGPQVQPVVNAVEMPAANQVQAQVNVQQPAANQEQIQVNVQQPAVNAAEMPMANQAQANVYQSAMQVNAPQVQPTPSVVADMSAVNQVQVQANVQQPVMQDSGPQVQQQIVTEIPETAVETVTQAASTNTEVSARITPAVNPEPVVANNSDQPRGNISVGDAPRITPEALEAVNQIQSGNNNPSGYEEQRNQQQSSFFQQPQQMVQPANSQGQVQPMQMPGEAAFDAAPVENAMQDTNSVAGANFQQMINNAAEARNTQQVQQPQQSPNDYEVPKQIVEHARMIRAGQNTEMVIKLNPQHLGELTLKIAVNSNGGVTATFHSDNATVRGIIETSMMQLKQELTEQGIKVDKIEISAGLQQDLQDMGQGYYAQQGRQGQRTMNNSGNSSGYENGEGSEGEGSIAGVEVTDGVPVNRSTESIRDNQGNIISGGVDYAV